MRDIVHSNRYKWFKKGSNINFDKVVDVPRYSKAFPVSQCETIIDDEEIFHTFGFKMFDSEVF